MFAFVKSVCAKSTIGKWLKKNVGPCNLFPSSIFFPTCATIRILSLVTYPFPPSNFPLPLSLLHPSYPQILSFISSFFFFLSVYVQNVWSWCVVITGLMVGGKPSWPTRILNRTFSLVCCVWESESTYVLLVLILVHVRKTPPLSFVSCLLTFFCLFSPISQHFLSSFQSWSCSIPRWNQGATSIHRPWTARLWNCLVRIV